MRPAFHSKPFLVMAMLLFAPPYALADADLHPHHITAKDQNGEKTKEGDPVGLKGCSFIAAWKIGDNTMKDVMSFTETTVSCLKLGLNQAPYQVKPIVPEDGKPATKKKMANVEIKGKDRNGADILIALEYRNGLLAGAITVTSAKGEALTTAIVCDPIKKDKPRGR